jgi:hypothetical protein
MMGAYFVVLAVTTPVLFDAYVDKGDTWGGLAVFLEV